MTIHARVLPTFPGAIIGSNGIGAKTAGGIVELSLKPEDFATAPNPPSPDATLLVIDDKTKDVQRVTANTLLRPLINETDALKDEAEFARDLARDAASDAVSQSNVPIYASVVGMAGTAVPEAITALRVNGYDLSGDGGAALYKRVDTEPAHPAKFLSSGSWWELREEGPVPLSYFGIRGVGYETAKFRAAVEYAGETGRALFHPGNLEVRLDEPIVCAKPFRLLGEGVEPLTNNTASYNTRGLGSWLFFDHEGAGIRISGPNGARSGSLFDKIGTVRPELPPADPSGSYTPTVRDFDIHSVNGDLDVTNCVPLNPFRWLRIGNGRLNTFNNKGQPINTGIQVDYSLDTCRHFFNHFWPYWSNHPGVRDYMRAEAEAYRYGRGDNHYIGFGFSIGYRHPIHLKAIDGVAGSNISSKLKIVGFDADLGGPLLRIDGSHNGSTVSVSGGSTFGSPSASAGDHANIEIAGTNCRVTVAGCDLREARGSVITVTGAGSNLLVGDGMIIGTWGKGTDPNAPVFAATGTSSSIRVAAPPLVVAGKAQVDLGNVLRTNGYANGTENFGFGSLPDANYKAKFSWTGALLQLLERIGIGGVVAAWKNNNWLLYTGMSSTGEFAVKGADADLGTDPLFKVARNGDVTVARSLRIGSAFADDAAAGAGGIPVGHAYRRTDGLVVWRRT